VVIAGGGFAGLEGLLALHALAGDRVHVTLVSPDTRFHHRPAATSEVFGAEAPLVYDLEAMVADVGAIHRLDRLAAVAHREKRVRLASFAQLDYDALILAVGARPVSSIPGALTFRDQRDVAQGRRLMSELRDGAIHRIAFAVPGGCTWPLPLYELALLAAAHADEHGVSAEITLVTPEAAPLEVFGSEASGLVGQLLAERGVRFLGRSLPTTVRRDGELVLQDGGAVQADRVLAVSRLHGPRITGVPVDRWGFVRAHASGHVEGLGNVYAAGDATTSPIKQGGLATQQADLIAQTIAAASGAVVEAPRARRVLWARLLGGERPILLRTELDDEGRPATATFVHEPAELALGMTAKVFARYLTPYLQSRAALAAV